MLFSDGAVFDGLISYIMIHNIRPNMDSFLGCQLICGVTYLQVYTVVFVDCMLSADAEVKQQHVSCYQHSCRV